MSTNDSLNISTAGIVAPNGSGTFNARTLAGTAFNVSVSNGDGVAGNPTLSLPTNIRGTGISFDSGSNIITSYIAGTAWTPVVTGSAVAGVGTYTIQTAKYLQIGKFVIMNFSVRLTAHTGSGNYQVTGFPFTPNTAISFYSEVLTSFNTWDASVTETRARILSGDTFVTIVECGNGLSNTLIQVQNKTTTVQGSICFFI